VGVAVVAARAMLVPPSRHERAFNLLDINGLSSVPATWAGHEEAAAMIWLSPRKVLYL
jgi:hypothetical protein